jgi:hypothetical protein
MHHKRRRPKNRRAGCLLCKPHKANGVKKRKLACPDVQPRGIRNNASATGTWRQEAKSHLAEVEQLADLQLEKELKAWEEEDFDEDAYELAIIEWFRQAGEE